MKIRSITYFCNPGWPLDESRLAEAGEFLNEARLAFEAAGFAVQTIRLATVSFARLLGPSEIGKTPRLAEKLEKIIASAGIAYAALGPALPELSASFAAIPQAVAASENIFFSGVMADRAGGISLDAIRACADVIVRCGTISPDGFANLRFAALANVKPGTPFFPAAYHDGDEPAFALATEFADLAVEAFSRAKSLEDGRQSLVQAIEENARALCRIADILKFRFGVRFGGVDYSLSPFPAEEQSLGAAFERMGVPRVGLHGSLAAAAILTEAIERADFARTGFSGLMMPVLEDAVLAQRAAEGTLSIKDVLLYSAVCGTGLDTIPLPGDTKADEIAPLLLDLSALAMRLDKPLTARLMPVPGKKAGDPTGFNFDFFANSRVMALDSAGLNAPMGKADGIRLQKRASE